MLASIFNKEVDFSAEKVDDLYYAEEEVFWLLSTIFDVTIVIYSLQTRTTTSEKIRCTTTCSRELHRFTSFYAFEESTNRKICLYNTYDGLPHYDYLEVKV